MPLMVARAASRPLDRLSEWQSVHAGSEGTAHRSTAPPAKLLAPITATSSRAIEELPVDLETPLE
eukprot:6961770-Pyramimonas_sp.AAC.1